MTTQTLLEHLCGNHQPAENCTQTLSTWLSWLCTQPNPSELIGQLLQLLSPVYCIATFKNSEYVQALVRLSGSRYPVECEIRAFSNNQIYPEPFMVALNHGTTLPAAPTGQKRQWWVLLRLPGEKLSWKNLELSQLFLQTTPQEPPLFPTLMNALLLSIGPLQFPLRHEEAPPETRQLSYAEYLHHSTNQTWPRLAETVFPLTLSAHWSFTADLTVYHSDGSAGYERIQDCPAVFNLSISFAHHHKRATLHYPNFATATADPSTKFYLSLQKGLAVIQAHTHLHFYLLRIDPRMQLDPQPNEYKSTNYHLAIHEPEHTPLDIYFRWQDSGTPSFRYFVKNDTKGVQCTVGRPTDCQSFLTALHAQLHVANAMAYSC